MRVTNLGAKVQETRLRWFGHVMRRDEEYVGQKVMRMEVQGQRRRGRQRKRWWELVKEDLKEKELDVESAQDRKEWKRLIGNSDPAWSGKS